MIPPRCTRVLQAAQAFDIAARADLNRRGLPATNNAIARGAGTTPSNYSSVFAGRRGTLSSIAKWIANWTASGGVPLEMVVRAQTVEVQIAVENSDPQSDYVRDLQIQLANATTRLTTIRTTLEGP